MNGPQRIAIEIAKKSQANFRVGSVLARKSTILGMGFNCSKTHPKGQGHYSSYHAEMRAIFNYVRLNDVKLFKNVALYVARVSKTGSLGLALPCPDCQELIYTMGIRDVYYTTSKGWELLKIQESGPACPELE